MTTESSVSSLNISPPLDVVQFNAPNQDTKLDSSVHKASGVKSLVNGDLCRITSDDGTVSSATTLRTAEETWFEDYCDSENTSCELSSPSSSPLESQRKTIALPRPVRRHRRNSSAVPRLQSSQGDLPPLPPRKASGTNSPLSFSCIRKHATSWDAAYNGSPSSESTGTRMKKPVHKRSNSTPLFVNLKEPSPLETLASQLVKLKQQYGKKDPRVASIWNMIGNIHFRNGCHDAAITAYREAIKCEPGDHLADSYGNMGTVLFKMGEVEESVVFFKNALSVQEYNVIAKGEDPNRSLKLATVQYQIGLAQTLTKCYEEAFEALKIACEIRAAVLGEKNAETAKTLDAIGKVYLLRNNHEAALACHKEALSIKENLDVDSDAKASSMLTTLKNIALVHEARKDLESAIFAYGDVLRTQKAMVKSGSSSWTPAAETLLLLSDLFMECKMYQKAQSCLREADRLALTAGAPSESSIRVAVSHRLSKF